MAKFIFIDQSLNTVGGHHYDYAINLVGAVEEMGYTPVLGAHRKLRDRSCFPENWQIIPCFRHTTFSRHAIFGHPGKLPQAFCSRSQPLGPVERSDRSRSLWSRFKASRDEHHRQSELRCFTQACQLLFSQVQLEPGDHVFFATISEFDLLGLADFLADFPERDVAQWHLQFHFDIFNGRPAEYGEQAERLQWVRSCFQHALKQAPGKRFRLYNTSQPLVEQYHRLGVGTFQNLPYPINPAFRPESIRCDTEIPRPLRVTCGGGFRAEQGKQHLAAGLADVWEEGFTSGRMQLSVQAKRSKWRKLGLPGSATASTGANATVPPPAVSLVPHPLAMDQYAELIRQTHIGLLMYDSRRYYARRAGVLCELLCAGVPVVVPAGCWLSEQIAEAGFEYLDQLCSQESGHSVLCANLGMLPQSDRRAEDVPIDLDVPATAGEMIISVHRHGAAHSADYVRMTVEQFDRHGQPLAPFSHVVGRRSGPKPARAMWRINPEARTLQLTLQDAYHASPVLVEDLQVTWLARGKTRPLSSVGAIAADEQHVGKLLLEIATHYPHYRRTAQTFSGPWRQQHDPRLTAATIISADEAVAGVQRAA